MVQLGLDAVLTGTPAAIAKTKVRLDLVHVLQGDAFTPAEGRKVSMSEEWVSADRVHAGTKESVGACAGGVAACWDECGALQLLARLTRLPPGADLQAQGQAKCASPRAWPCVLSCLAPPVRLRYFCLAHCLPASGLEWSHVLKQTTWACRRPWTRCGKPCAIPASCVL